MIQQMIPTIFVTQTRREVWRGLWEKQKSQESPEAASPGVWSTGVQAASAALCSWSTLDKSSVVVMQGSDDNGMI